MRKLLVVVLAGALLATLAGAALAATRTIRVGDNYFVRAGSPPSVTVRRGDTVVWRFSGRAPHNVAAIRGPQRFRSPVRTSGTYRRRMTRPGTYSIICEIHGSRQRMTLRVR
jgi:plastocyanin